MIQTLRDLFEHVNEHTDEFDFKHFNDGDYERAVYDKMFSENISKALYPNDQNAMGKELRLKQEHFFTSASISDIIRRFNIEKNNIHNLNWDLREMSSLSRDKRQ